MANITVYQIVLKACTYYGEGITVSLYSGETLAGQCKSHNGGYHRETLSCDRVAADRVKLNLTNTRWTTKLWVYEIEVKGSIIPPLPGKRHEYMLCN